MIGENISITPVNVELSQERENHIKRHFLPLLQLIDSPHKAQLDVILRAIQRPVSGRTYCIMLRLINSEGEVKYAVAMSRYFERAVREARDDLRKSMSRNYTPDVKAVNYLREKAHERYFVELFV